MDEEQILNLFDIYWFYHQSTEKSPSPPPPPPPPLDQAAIEAETQIENPPISRFRSFHRRSHSDQTSSKTDPFSPSSVLPAPKLETIFSGKEAGDQVSDQEKVDRPSKKASGRRKTKGSSRSLSDLEFEELKGFQDLGFTFPEAEMDSRLLSILPGLQRLGKDIAGEEEENGDESHVVSRPYLSEAWSFDEVEEEDPLTNWRISAVGDEIDMKDQLRFWAHAVASTVR